MIIPNATSSDFPDYMKVRNSPLNEPPKLRVQPGKKCYPDLSQGVSYEFPTYFNNKNQLNNYYTKPNQYMDENFIRNSVRDFKKAKLELANQSPEIGMRYSTIQNDKFNETNEQMKTVGSMTRLTLNEEEIPKDNKMRASNRFLRNAQYKRNSQSVVALNKEEQRKHRQFDGEMIVSGFFKGFQDYNINKECETALQNQVAIEQAPQALYDPLTNTQKIVQGPPMRMESYSKVRENYYKLLTTQPKAFNRKLGLFSHFVDKTIADRMKFKAEKDQDLQPDYIPSLKTEPVKATRHITDISPINKHTNSGQMFPQLSKNLSRAAHNNEDFVSTKSMLSTLNDDFERSDKFNKKNPFNPQQSMNQTKQSIQKTEELQKEDDQNDSPTEKLRVSTLKYYNDQNNRKTSYSNFAKKIELQNKTLRKMLPATQSIQDIKGLLEPKYSKSKNMMSLQNLHYKHMQEIHEERDRSIEDYRQLDAFDEKMKKMLQLNDQSISTDNQPVGQSSPSASGFGNPLRKSPTKNSSHYFLQLIKPKQEQSSFAIKEGIQ